MTTPTTGSSNVTHRHQTQGKKSNNSEATVYRLTSANGKDTYQQSLDTLENKTKNTGLKAITNSESSENLSMTIEQHHKILEVHCNTNKELEAEKRELLEKVKKLESQLVEKSKPTPESESSQNQAYEKIVKDLEQQLKEQRAKTEKAQKELDETYHTQEELSKKIESLSKDKESLSQEATLKEKVIQELASKTFVRETVKDLNEVILELDQTEKERKEFLNKNEDLRKEAQKSCEKLNGSTDPVTLKNEREKLMTYQVTQKEIATLHDKEMQKIDDLVKKLGNVRDQTTALCNSLINELKTDKKHYSRRIGDVKSHLATIDGIVNPKSYISYLTGGYLGSSTSSQPDKSLSSSK